jgi:prephenate dehydratase
MEKMGILGPRGTHSEAAAVKLNEFLTEKVELVIFKEIFETLNAIEEKEIDSAFVPVENSLEGSVNITLDTLASSDSLIVTRELVYPVHNFLMAREGVEMSAVKKIFSHAQPISQCRNYLREKFSNAEINSVPSTARAAEMVAESEISEGYAAICSERAGTLNGLKILAKEIQDNYANCTRFLEVRRRPKDFDVYKMFGEKNLIICQIDGSKPGALYEVLGEFARHNINMTRIESRPARTELGKYIFFFDLEVDTFRRMLFESVKAVRQKSIWLKNLGIFPVIRV